MAYWVVVVPGDAYGAERLIASDALVAPADGPRPGDLAVLVVDADEPLLFGAGRLREDGLWAYTHRKFDEPEPAAGLENGGPGVRALGGAAFAEGLDRLGPASRVDADKRTWLVSLDLPIEANTPAEAVRIFWSYVRDLGPAELPAFVAPTGDELALQAFVLGTEANQDPEDN